MFYSGFISNQIKVAYCRCEVTNEFIHKCWVCFGNKCCFVFFICNKTFTALLPNDQPACVMIFRKDLHLLGIYLKLTIQINPALMKVLLLNYFLTLPGRQYRARRLCCFDSRIKTPQKLSKNIWLPSLKKGRIYCRSVAKRNLVLIALYQFNPRIPNLYFVLFDRFSHHLPHFSNQTEKRKWEMVLYCTMWSLAPCLLLWWRWTKKEIILRRKIPYANVFCKIYHIDFKGQSPSIGQWHAHQCLTIDLNQAYKNCEFIL